LSSIFAIQFSDKNVIALGASHSGEQVLISIKEASQQTEQSISNIGMLITD
jgi:hypothetical protein